MTPQLLWRIKLGEGHQPTGKTRHYSGGTECPKPSELRIVQYLNDPGIYLFYCDDAGREVTDTYHDSVEQAKDQAEFEFKVKPTEWEPG